MSLHLLQALLQESPAELQLEALDRELPFVPLDAPRMPLPGPNFEQAARDLGDNPPCVIEGARDEKRVASYGPHLHYLYRRALYDPDFRLGVRVKGRVEGAAFVPGHLLGNSPERAGPRRASVMLLGKHPGREEVAARMNFVGPTSDELFAALRELGLDDPDWAPWYAANLVKFPQLDLQSDSLPKDWIKDCAVLLAEELRLVRPDYLLCLGSHASKHVLGTWAGVESMTGRVETLRVPIFNRGEDPRWHEIKVMSVMHPALVYRRPELFEPFKDQLQLFLQLTRGVDVGGRETNVDHQVIYKERQLARIVDAVRADPSRWVISVDGEWEGDFPTEPGAYLRSVQFSTRHGEGITVALRHQHGFPAFQPSIDAAIYQLNRLFQEDEEQGYRPCVGGWFFRADLPWLLHNGIDLRKAYRCPPTIEQARSGGWEGSLMYHAVHEAASYRLEDVASRLTTAPRYDKRLERWKTQYCRVQGIKSEDLPGYGQAPDWVLLATDGSPNYSSYDPDVARRIAVECARPGGKLDADAYGLNSWRPYWNAHRASPAFLEMEMRGILLDQERLQKLTRSFLYVREKLVADFRSQINWVGSPGRDGSPPHPPFNPASSKHCAAFLFGDRYAYRTDKATGQRIAVRPPQAMTLGLEPIKSTGKRSKAWPQLVARGEDQHHTPSTDKEVLGILGHSHPLAMMLRDIKFVDQALKTVLRPPAYDDQAGAEVRDEEGSLIYEKGLPSFMHSDGRLRTHLSQTKETGRASSYRPPLQNLSSRREDDFARIFGKWETDKATGARRPKGAYLRILQQPLYEHPIRSLLRASPGCVLVQCDLTGAELAVLAWTSNDPVMIDHVRRNNLPESHPDHYDIHSRQAVKAFHLTCPPTKTGLSQAGQKGKRVAAKNVNFGVPYGRSADPIARQCREEGVEITIEEAQLLIDAYFETYSQVGDYLAACRGRVHDPRTITTPFGRHRRFSRSHDRTVIGEQERQAQNVNIQSTVADAINRAMDNLWEYRLANPETPFHFLLQIHDALLFEVPVEHVRTFAQDEVDQDGNILRPSILRTCMIDQVPIWPTYLDGQPMAVAEPYFFGVDTDIQLNWGEEITPELAAEIGLDPALLK